MALQTLVRRCSSHSSYTLHSPCTLSYSTQLLLRRNFATEPLPFESIPGPKDIQHAMQEYMQCGGFQRGMQVFKRFHETYGKLVRLPSFNPSENQLIAFDPEDFKTVFQADGTNPIGAAEFAVPFKQWFHSRGDHNFAFARDEKWKRLRGVFQRDFFAPQDAENYLPAISTLSEKAVQLLPKYQDKLHEYIPRVTFQMIATIVFNADLQVLELDSTKDAEYSDDQKYVTFGMEIFELADKLMFTDPRSPEYAALFQTFDAHLAFMNDRGSVHLQKTLKRIRESKGSAEADCYLAKLLQREDSKNVTEEEINSNVAGLLIAGVDTTANTLQWFIWNIARTPTVQEQLYREVSSVLQGRSLTKEDIPKLPLMRAALKENFRVTPTVQSGGRRLTKDIVLKGYQVPAGTMMIMASWPVFMDPNIFPKPKEFDPNRWIKEKTDRTAEKGAHEHPYLVMPFSRGPRMCAGARVAELEILSLMSRLIQDFKVEVAPGSPIPELATCLTIKPDPKPTYTFTKRKN